MVDGWGLFMAMGTQWRLVGAGMGGIVQTGLDYTAIEPTARVSGITLTPPVFNDLRALEGEALRYWASRRT